MIAIDLNDLRGCFGLGVAGNFAGHLEQAGEAADFANVGGAGQTAPKGIFPFYVPGSESFLGRFPLSNDRIAKPALDGPVNLQIEPEVGLLCNVDYAADGAVEALAVTALAALNDCSIRRPDAGKISEKKNWGRDSEGVARTFFEARDLDPAGSTRTLRLACFLHRDGQTHAYGVDSPVIGYSYYGARLLDWIVERLNNQSGATGTPLEDVGALLRACGQPARMLIGIGATRYTELGENTFLEEGDESVVVVYDGDVLSQRELARQIHERRDADLAGASILRQTVYDAQ